VSRVLVDDNNRVHKGDLLAELDREPYEVIVAIKKAAVDTAKADLASAEASVRGIVGASAGNSSTPSRTSTTRSNCFRRRSPPSIKARPH